MRHATGVFAHQRGVEPLQLPERLKGVRAHPRAKRKTADLVLLSSLEYQPRGPIVKLVGVAFYKGLVQDGFAIEQRGARTPFMDVMCRPHPVSWLDLEQLVPALLTVMRLDERVMHDVQALSYDMAQVYVCSLIRKLGGVENP